MKSTIQSVYKLSDMLDNNEAENASSESIKVIYDLAEMLVNSDFNKAEEIKRLLDDETISLQVNNYNDYTLGRTHAVI
jgi:hypothetical protein